MIASIAMIPGMIMVVGSLLLPVLDKKSAWGALALSIASLVLLLITPFGTSANVEVLGNALTMVRIDKLSFIFALVLQLEAMMS